MQDTQVGDRLLFFDPEAGLPVGSEQIESMVYDPTEAAWRVSLSGPVGPLSPGTDKANTTVYNLSRTGNGFVLRYNTFRNSRRFGNLIKSHHGLIEGNHYEGLSSAAITIHNEPSWPEGLSSERILVRDNVIRRCGFDTSYLGPRKGAIELYLHRLPYAPAPWMGQRDIRILNNEISDWQCKAIAVENGQEIVVAGNRIGSSARPPDFLTQTNYGIFVKHSRDVRIKDNLISDSRPLSEAIHVEDSEEVVVE